MNPKNTPSNITSLKHNQIFCFGSNTRGFHGAGAARYAAKHFGAEYGVGEGKTGQCYAFPTKDENIKTLSLDKIKEKIPLLLKCCNDYPEKEFLLTRIGTGLAGFSDEQIASLFKDYKDELPNNLVFPIEFKKVIQENSL